MTLDLDKSTWKRVAFGDVVDNVNETVRDREAAGIDRVIAMEHMDPGELKISRWGSTADGTTFTRRVTPGQTLFGKRRAYQRKVAYADFEAICSGDIYTFEADESQMLGELLPFLVQSNEFFDHALGTSAGSLSPRTNWRDLANFEFDLPPLHEQERIAELLWAIERRRASLVVLVHALRSSEDALVAQLTANTPAKPLGDIVSTVLDRRGVTPTKMGGEFVPSGVPVLSAMNVVAGRIDRSRQERYVSAPVAARWMPTGPLRAGDILMTSEAPLGSTVFIEGDYECCLGQRLFAIRPDQNEVFPEFLYAWLTSNAGQKALEERASGTTVKGIRQAELVKVKVPVPPKSAQSSFAAIWRHQRLTVTTVETDLARLAKLVSAFLAEIFGGG